MAESKVAIVLLPGQRMTMEDFEQVFRYDETGEFTIYSVNSPKELEEIARHHKVILRRIHGELFPLDKSSTRRVWKLLEAMAGLERRERKANQK